MQSGIINFDTTSYCGPPPLPETLWARWNLDPLLLAGFAMAVAIFLLTQRDATRAERAAFSAGLATLAIAFVSPLCALTVALFSARVVHHVVLVAIAAPLFALACCRGGAWAAKMLAPLFALHTAVFWLWHLPAAYTLALTDTAVYWAMQASLLISATLMWMGIFSSTRHGQALGTLLGSIVQMGMLGALLVFASSALYPPHIATTEAFGFSPIADQQLGGILMWVPASLPYLAAGLWRVFQWLDPQREAQAQ